MLTDVARIFEEEVKISSPILIRPRSSKRNDYAPILVIHDEQAVGLFWSCKRCSPVDRRVLEVGADIFGTYRQVLREREVVVFTICRCAVFGEAMQGHNEVCGGFRCNDSLDLP